MQNILYEPTSVDLYQLTCNLSFCFGKNEKWNIAFFLKEKFLYK